MSVQAGRRAAWETPAQGPAGVVKSGVAGAQGVGSVRGSDVNKAEGLVAAAGLVGREEVHRLQGGQLVSAGGSWLLCTTTVTGCCEGESL